MTNAVAVVRRFNRSLTQRIGALNTHYLGRHRPLVESRLVFEIGARGAPIRELRARLGLDSGFMSRTLRSLEQQGMVRTAKARSGDARVRVARLTGAGRAELHKLNALSNALARSILAPLTQAQRQRLVLSMTEVERLLDVSSVELRIAHPATRDATWCLQQYSAELAARFRNGYDSKADNVPAGRFAPPHGSFLVARLHGQPVGCGALRFCDRRTGEIKRLWVAPRARGMGIGRRIVGELEMIASRRGLRAVRLDTNEALTEARRLYGSCGYRAVERFNDSPYAHHWFAKLLAPSRTALPDRRSRPDR
jgi:DNA-binding MarR family transcriptional regulator/GNAT superfamily N-acetyltransferase